MYVCTHRFVHDTPPGESLTVKNIVDLMVLSEISWDAVNKFVRTLNVTLTKAEEARKAITE